MNIVLAVEEFAGLQLLKALARSNHRIAAVLTTPPESGAVGGVNLWNFAKDLGLETLPAELVKDSALGERLRAAHVDLLLNVHSLYIVHGDVLAAPRVGAFNLHPGPLPRYAGLNAINWAIYNGEKSHGVTVHKMESGIDTGAIVYQTLFPIEDEDTGLTLNFKCTQKGVPLMLKLLETASTRPDELPLEPQDLSRRDYFGSSIPQNGWLSWLAPAENIVNFVRACDYFPFRSPWGHPATKLGKRELSVVKASRTRLPADAAPGTVGQLYDTGALVAAADEWVLVKKLKIGSQYLAATDALKSGDRLETSN
jgi:methionyl-tRNA formyltransferase